MTPWTYLCGLDFGVVDENAVAVLAWREHDPCVYVVEAYRLKATVTGMAAEVHRLERTYEFSRIVGDVGGMGKAFADEMQTRHHIPVEAAEKHNKPGYIALFNADLKRGRIKVVRPRCLQLLEEWRDLAWADNRQKEADGFPNHCADAVLYAWRAALAFYEVEPAPAPTRDEVIAEYERELVDADEAAARKLAGGEWDEWLT